MPTYMQFRVHLTVSGEDGLVAADDWQALLEKLEWLEPNRNPQGRWKQGNTLRASYALDVRSQTIAGATKAAVDAVSRAIDSIRDLNGMAFVERVRPVYVPRKDEL